MSIKYLEFVYALQKQHPELAKQIEQDKDYICPDLDNIFKSLELTLFDKAKFIVIGSEPYNTAGKANGLCFGQQSSYDGPISKSLSNIRKEIYESTGQTLQDLTLESLASQGVVLLNMRLTSVIGKRKAHLNLGWEETISTIVSEISLRADPVAWLLLGRDTHQLDQLIDNPIHKVIKTCDPARNSFVGCNCFEKVNEYLASRGQATIKWGDYLS